MRKTKPPGIRSAGAIKTRNPKKGDKDMKKKKKRRQRYEKKEQK
jgi:hypothetical protein